MDTIAIFHLRQYLIVKKEIKPNALELIKNIFYAGKILAIRMSVIKRTSVFAKSIILNGIKHIN